MTIQYLITINGSAPNGPMHQDEYAEALRQLLRAHVRMFLENVTHSRFQLINVIRDGAPCDENEQQ